MRSIRTGWVLLSILLLASLGVQASGTYRGGPPRQPSSVDREAYDQGKRIFTGQADLAAAAADADAQRARLADWQSRLPSRVQESTDLPSLAGKLSDQQMAHLEYYLGVRYKVK